MVRSFLILAFLLFCSASQAGVYADDMGKCLVASTSPQDKAALVRWIFATAALHPDVASIASVSAATREEMDRNIAALFERLVTDACRQQTIEAVRYEGAALAFHVSFGMLGQVAMQELMSDREVSASFDNFTQYLDKAKFEALGLSQ